MKDVVFDSPQAAGLHVRERRQELHLSQKQLADLAGVSRKFLVSLEAGHPRAELGKTMQVLKAVGFDVRGHRRTTPRVHRTVDLGSHVRALAGERRTTRKQPNA